MNQYRIIRVLGLTSAIVVAIARPGRAQVEELKPNLVALPATNISFDTLSTSPKLIFATTSWNNGRGPMEIREGATSTAGQDVWQRVYNSDGSYTDYLAGTFEYHPEHLHFHFNKYALYTLKQVGAPGGSEKTSQKTSFCLMDTNAINTSLPGAPNSAVYTTCTATFQGISVGWSDRYGQTLPGQSFDMTGSAEADYDLTIQIDPIDLQHPAGRLLEISESDNVSCVRLHINPVARTVQNLGACSNVTIASVSPGTVAPGTTTELTITGAGFAAGMAVGFENGSGPAPVIRNITFVNSTTYRVTISIKNGGSKQARYWDVRVGSGVLPRGLKIQP